MMTKQEKCDKIKMAGSREGPHAKRVEVQGGHRGPRHPGGRPLLFVSTGRVLMIGGTMADFDDGDIIRAAGAMIYDGSDEVVNVYHMRVNSGGGKSWAEVDSDIQDYFDQLVDTMDTELSDLMVADRISVSNVTQDTVFGAIPWGVFTQGGNATDATAAGVCCFTFARTRKPRVQIRKYFGVFPKESMALGEWDAGVTAACGDALDYHIAENIMNSGIRLQGVAYNRTLTTYEYAVSVATRGEPAYQRRRKRGVGS